MKLQGRVAIITGAAAGIGFYRAGKGARRHEIVVLAAPPG